MIALVTALVASIAAQPASAETSEWAEATCGPSSCEGKAGREHSSARPGRSPRRPPAIVCTYTPINLNAPAEVYDVGGTPTLVDGRGEWFDKACHDTVTGFGVGTTLVYIPRRTPEELRDEAFARLSASEPRIALSPGADRTHLVNMPTWLAVDGGWDGLSSTASVPGVTVTVVARPSRVVWKLGDGAEVVCSGPGSVFDPHRPDGRTTSDCSHTWRRSSGGGRFRVTATIEWSVEWTATGAPGGGDLGVITNSSSVEVRVAEARTVNVRRRR